MNTAVRNKIAVIGLSGLSLYAIISIIGTSSAPAGNAPSSSVTVVNTSANPVPVVQKGTVPVSGACHIVVTEPAFAGTTNLYFVPSGKRLVVEHISGVFSVPAGTKILQGNLSTGSAIIFLLPVFSGLDLRFATQHDTYLFSQLVRFYVEPGQALEATIVENDSGQADGTYQFSGYLVDAP